MTDREAMQQALESLERVALHLMRPQDVEVMQALRTALEQPEQEAVVFYRCNGCGHAYEQFHPTSCDCMEAGGFDRVEYYTTPPSAQRKPLTKEEIWEIHDRCIPPAEGYVSPVDFARAIEAAHGIGEKP